MGRQSADQKTVARFRTWPGHCQFSSWHKRRLQVLLNPDPFWLQQAEQVGTPIRQPFRPPNVAATNSVFRAAGLSDAYSSQKTASISPRRDNTISEHPLVWGIVDNRGKRDGRAWRMFLDMCYRWRNNLGHCDSFIILNAVVLVSCFLVYLANQYCFKRLSDHFIIHGYLNDFLAMPLLLSYSNILIFVGKRHRILLTTLKSVIPFTILVGLFWEYVTPLYRSSKCCDPYDLIAYILGSLMYWTIVKTFKHLTPDNRRGSTNTATRLMIPPPWGFMWEYGCSSKHSIRSLLAIEDIT